MKKVADLEEQTLQVRLQGHCYSLHTLPAGWKTVNESDKGRGPSRSAPHWPRLQAHGSALGQHCLLRTFAAATELSRGDGVPDTIPISVKRHEI